MRPSWPSSKYPVGMVAKWILATPSSESIPESKYSPIGAAHDGSCVTTAIDVAKTTTTSAGIKRLMRRL